MTTYVILRRIEVSDQGDGARAWLECRELDARSDAAALRSFNPVDGEYIAIPARSFRPRTVRAEQTTRLTIT